VAPGSFPREKERHPRRLEAGSPLPEKPAKLDESKVYAGYTDRVHETNGVSTFDTFRPCKSEYITGIRQLWSKLLSKKLSGSNFRHDCSRRRPRRRERRLERRYLPIPFDDLHCSLTGM
jgi:hypothetical protein